MSIIEVPALNDAAVPAFPAIRLVPTRPMPVTAVAILVAIVESVSDVVYETVAVSVWAATFIADVAVAEAGAAPRPKSVRNALVPLPVMVAIVTPLDDGETSMASWFDPLMTAVADVTSNAVLVPIAPAPWIAVWRPAANAVRSVSDPTVYVTLSVKAAVLTEAEEALVVPVVAPVIVVRLSFEISEPEPLLLSARSVRIVPALMVRVPPE